MVSVEKERIHFSWPLIVAIKKAVMENGRALLCSPTFLLFILIISLFATETRKSESTNEEKARPLRCFTGFVEQRSTASTVAKDFSTQGYCTLLMVEVLFNLTELYYVAMFILSQVQLLKEISNILAKSAVKVYARIKTLFSVHNVKYGHTPSVSVYRKGYLNIIWTTLK